MSNNLRYIKKTSENELEISKLVKNGMTDISFSGNYLVVDLDKLMYYQIFRTDRFLIFDCSSLEDIKKEIRIHKISKLV